MVDYVGKVVLVVVIVVFVLVCLFSEIMVIVFLVEGFSMLRLLGWIGLIYFLLM